MNFKTATVSPTDLILDKKNPRIIVGSNCNESDIITYLLKYEEIIDLIKGIDINKGLLVGERIIVFEEDNKYIVAEGNRRTCACKLMLNNKLIPDKFKKFFPEISDETIKNISKISVDIVKDRKEALNSMGTKHISGVKQWSSYAKMRFFALQFKVGKSIKELSLLTSVSKNEIETYIKNFNIISYAKSLDIWSEDEKNRYFDFHKDKATIFPRALTIKSKKLNKSLSKILNIQYDKNTLMPFSDAPKKLLNYCIYMLAKYSYDEEIKFNTRSTIDEIPGIIDILEKYINNNTIPDNILSITTSNYINKTEYESENGLENKLEDNSEYELRNKSENELEDNSEYELRNKSENKLEDNSEYELRNKSENELGYKLKDKRAIKRPKTLKFFSALKWSGVDNKNSENNGLIYLCKEIQQISKSGDYEKYPIAATILTRALFEQTLIYYLKKINKYENLAKDFNGKVPPLEKTIKYYKKNVDNIFKDKNIERSFLIFTHSDANKDYFDMVIHNPQLVKVSAHNLDNLVENGLRGFIESILNL